MLHVCDACYSLKKGNDDVSIRSLRVKRLSRPWLDLGCHGKAVDCSEHERCKTVCVKSDIKLLILKTLMIFKFRFLGWRTGLSKATHMKSLIVWGWAVRGSIPCVSYIRHQTDYDLQDIVNDTQHLFGDIQVLILVWILADLLRRPKRKHAAMACSEMTALNCWPFSILNSCGPASVAFAMWSQNVVMQYIWNQTASHGFERFSVPVYVCVGVCVLFVVLCCVVVFVWWCCGGVFVFVWWCFFLFCGGVFTEELCKERWQHWCKKISGIKVLPTLLIFTITSNISFIQLPSFNCL